LLKAAAAAIESYFPNPDRRGCPPPDTVRQLARRRIPLPETGELVDHVATCSPCFQVYNRYRRPKLARVIGTTVLATIVLISLALVWRYRTAHEFTSPPQIAHVPAAPILSAMSDYREASPTRSTDVQVARTETPRLPTSLLNLTILLPFGTEDGQYAIQIRGSNGDPVSTASGTAQWSGTAEALAAKLDLRHLPAGAYSLAVRKGEASWHSYPLILEQAK